MRNQDFGKISGEFDKIANPQTEKKSYSDDRFWRLEGDKAGNGTATFRFLPRVEGDELPWVRIFSHGFQGPTGKWYIENSLTTLGENDPVGDLDVTILSEKVLTPLLNIVDLRKDNRIDFVGGIRGLRELKRRVDSGEMVAAFALYPVTMEQLLTIADAGEIMPPKTTWFEPKLRSGLFVHDLE